MTTTTTTKRPTSPYGVVRIIEMVLRRELDAGATDAEAIEAVSDHFSHPVPERDAAFRADAEFLLPSVKAGTIDDCRHLVIEPDPIKGVYLHGARFDTRPYTAYDIRRNAMSPHLDPADDGPEAAAFWIAESYAHHETAEFDRVFNIAYEVLERRASAQRRGTEYVHEEV